MSEVDTSGGFDQAVEISLLNDVPDVLRDEVKKSCFIFELTSSGEGIFGEVRFLGN